MLYPGHREQLEISQEEIGYLSGVSRQRVNQALTTLGAHGLIGIEYGGVRVRDLVNTPTEHMGPDELEAVARELEKQEKDTPSVGGHA